MRRLIFFFLIFVPIVYGVSVRPASRTYHFDSNMQESFHFTVGGANRINVSIEQSYLSQYFTLEDPNPMGGPRTVKVHMNMPEKLEKMGKLSAHLSALEVAEEANHIKAVTEIRAPIFIIVPYEGLYASITFHTKNVNEGETAEFKLKVKNIGTIAFDDASAEIDIYSGEEKIRTISTNSITLESKESGEIFAYLDTQDIKPGSYRAVARFDYGKTETVDKIFRVGTLEMNILSYTREIRAGEIEKFQLRAESGWNNEIEDVFAEIAINGTTVKTPSYDVNPWQLVTFETYIDASNMAAGSYPMEIVLNYADKQETQKATLELTEVHEEAPQSASTTPLLMLGILVIILIGIIVLIIDKK